MDSTNSLLFKQLNIQMVNLEYLDKKKDLSKNFKINKNN